MSDPRPYLTQPALDQALTHLALAHRLLRVECVRTSHTSAGLRQYIEIVQALINAMGDEPDIDLSRVDPYAAVQGGVGLLARHLEKALNEVIDEMHLWSQLAKMRQPIIQGVTEIMEALERGDDPEPCRQKVYAYMRVYRAAERAKLFDSEGRLVVDTRHAHPVA